MAHLDGRGRPTCGSLNSFARVLRRNAGSAVLSAGLYAALLAGAGCGDEEHGGSSLEPLSPGSRTLGEQLCVSTRLPLGDDAASVAERDSRLTLLGDLGVGRLRLAIDWTEVEPTRSNFQFAGLDTLVGALGEGGFEVIARLAYGNPWATAATDSDPYFPPDDPADFARWAGEIASRYSATIDRYEIWSEPNSGFRFWKGTEVGGDAEAYGTLLGQSAAAIRGADADAEIIYGGLFYNAQVVPGASAFLTEHFTVDPGAGAHFDALAYHPYTLFPPSAPPEADTEGETPFRDMSETLRATLAAFGSSGKPLYATEFGWPSFEDVSEERQAAWLVRGTLWLAASDLEWSCWHTLSDGPLSGQLPPDDDFGLVTTSGVRKPAFEAMRFLARRLGTMALVGDVSEALSLPGGAYAFELRRPDGSAGAHAVWVANATGRTTLRLPGLARGAVAYDATGAEVTFENQDGDALVSVGALPVYIVRGDLD